MGGGLCGAPPDNAPCTATDNASDTDAVSAASVADAFAHADSATGTDAALGTSVADVAADEDFATFSDAALPASVADAFAHADFATDADAGMAAVAVGAVGCPRTGSADRKPDAASEPDAKSKTRSVSEAAASRFTLNKQMDCCPSTSANLRLPVPGMRQANIAVEPRLGATEPHDASN